MKALRKLQFDIRLLGQRRLAVTASILVILLFLTGSRALGAVLFDVSLLRLLHSSLCNPDWYACGRPKSQYPPQHWRGNGDQLAQVFVMFEQAAQFAPHRPAIQEYLMAIEYGLGRDTQATRRFEELATRHQLRPVIFSPSGSPAFHFLYSRAQEARADLQGAIEAQHQGLQLAPFALSPEREAKEVQRLSHLYGEWIESVDPPASDLYAATLAAACAADWNNAWARAERLLPDLTLLDSEQRSVIVRMLAYRARLSGDTLQESEWLAKADPLAWDQWSTGDPYLWLGKRLSSKGLEECSAGPLSIFRWYADQQSTSAQGLYLQGELLYWRGDNLGAQRAWLDGYRRDPRHSGCTFGLASIAELQGRIDESASWFEQVVRLQPANGEFRARLARTYHQQGRDIDASEQFDQAVMLAPQNDMVLAWAAYFYVDTKDLSRARYLLQQAYELNPANTYARLGMERIDSFLR